MLNISEKINKLPQDIQDILFSDYGNELENKIFDNFQMPSEKFCPFSDIILFVYLKELQLKDLVAKIKEVLAVNDIKAKKIAADLAGMRFLAIESYLGENVGLFINSLGGNAEEYKKYIIETKKRIKKEKGEIMEKEENKENKQGPLEEEFSGVDLEKEREDSLIIFSSSLVDILEVRNNPYLENYNFILMELLYDDSFKKSLENALFSNQEKLTHKEFILDGKPHSPSIANWLKDFIKNSGSGIFDNLVLSQYIIKSENAKKLDSKEKDLLRKLLILYRNLKFFPESMPDDDGENWEIIPLDEEEKPIGRSRKAERKEDPRVAELNEMLKQYSPGSLERKAVEEELKKIRTTD